MLGLFNAQLLYISRLPYVLACDGWFPGFLSLKHPPAQEFPGRQSYALGASVQFLLLG